MPQDAGQAERRAGGVPSVRGHVYRAAAVTREARGSIFWTWICARGSWARPARRPKRSIRRFWRSIRAGSFSMRSASATRSRAARRCRPWFSIDPMTGKLTSLNQQSSRGAGPCHLVVDHAGKNVLVANYGSGSVACLPIDADGRLQAKLGVHPAQGLRSRTSAAGGAARPLDQSRCRGTLCRCGRPGSGQGLRLPVRRCDGKLDAQRSAVCQGGAGAPARGTSRFIPTAGSLTSSTRWPTRSPHSLLTPATGR